MSNAKNLQSLKDDLRTFDEKKCRDNCSSLCLDDWPCCKKTALAVKIADLEEEDNRNQDIADKVAAKLTDSVPVPGGNMYAIDATKAITIGPTKFNPPFSFMFGNSKGERVGILQETPEGSLTFTGQADAAAQEFFNHVIELHHRTLRELRMVKAAATIVVNDAMNDARSFVHPCDVNNLDIVARSLTPELQELYQAIYK